MQTLSITATPVGGGVVGAGSTLTITFSIHNRGSAASGTFTVSFDYGDGTSSGTDPLVQKQYGSLDAEGTRNDVLIATLPNTVLQGQRYVHYTIDSASCGSCSPDVTGYIDLQITAAPNLQTQSVSVAKTQLSPGESTQADFLFYNAGYSRIDAAFTNASFLSPDAQITLADVPLVPTFTLSGLLARTASSTESGTITIPPNTIGGGGSYYVGGFSDSTLLVTEHTETDNGLGTPVTILASTCSDTFKNQDESDVDCGGTSCSGCAAGKTCNINTDCQSTVCGSGICVSASCGDLVKNGSETDVDCGGGTCGPCANGRSCAQANDCQSNVCSGGSCATPTCADGVKNGSETDIDCGGPNCGGCGTNKACSGSSDCQSGVCTGGLCSAPSCADATKNGTETDVDCGGSCAACADGDSCLVAGDCQSGVCTGNVCATAACNDTVQNGSETDIDCGGPTCSGCSAGQGCNANTDCQSSICDTVAPIPQCIAAGCIDTVKNGSETDVDCGGPLCSPCVSGQTCSVATDCESGICDPSNMCTVPSCQDGVLNQAETDVDCGNGANTGCNACAAGRSCRQGSDCDSGLCGADNRCTSATCSDGAKNGDETDTDCGGTCVRCATSKTCQANTDCESDFCKDGTCTAPSCTDGVKNGDETDTDCGGTCDRCADGKACSDGKDCATGLCLNAVCGFPSTMSDAGPGGNVQSTIPQADDESSEDGASCAVGGTSTGFPLLFLSVFALRALTSRRRKRTISAR